MAARRRLVTRQCSRCGWHSAAVELQSGPLRCPRCRAPSRIVHEERLFDAAELRAQAAAYGRIGGLKGGRIRADRLSPRRRREIARQAAEARWRRR